MTAIISIIALVLFVTLYDHFSARTWQQVTSSNRNELVFAHRNRAYGAYAIRSNYEKRMVIIMGGLFLLIGLIYTSWVIYKNLPEPKIIAKPVDQTQISMVTPPEEKVIPPPPEETPPPMEETVAFMPPIVTDTPTDDVIPLQDDLDKTKASDKTQDGDPDNFGPPVETGDTPPTETKAPEPETFVDEEAEFDGGYPKMMEFIKKNLDYPETAIANNIQGKCFLRFVVSVEGVISQVQVQKGVPDCEECDKAAIKAIKAMPRWKPAKLNGRSVASYCLIPINFQLQ